MSTQETQNEQNVGQVISIPISQGKELRLQMNDLPSNIRMLFGSLQERRQTIDYLNQLSTRLTETNGVDSSTLTRLISEFAAANPNYIVSTE